MEDTSFFIEFLPGIQTAHVCVSTTSSQLTFGPKHILQANSNEEEHVLASWEDTQLLVSSHQRLRIIQGEGLHVRFKSLSQGRLAIVLCNELSEYGCEDCLLSIKCSFCGAQFVKGNYSFQRVLPLPSDSWEEMSPHIFCHRHDNHGSDDNLLSSPVDGKLLPREGACLISDDVIITNSSALDNDSITIKDEVLNCARCHFNVGALVDIKARRFLRSRVRVLHCSEEDSGCVLDKRMMSEDYFARRLHRHSTTNTSFKFLIKDQHKRPFIQVWMLNVVSSVLISDSLTSDVMDKFSGDSAHYKNASVVLKILYKNEMATSTQDQESKMVDVLQLSTEECLQLILLLVASTQVLPPSQRVANGYQVGFLSINS